MCLSPSLFVVPVPFQLPRMKSYHVFVGLACHSWPLLSNAIQQGLNGDYVDRCPVSSSELSDDSSASPRVHKIEDLQLCDEPLITVGFQCPEPCHRTNDTNHHSDLLACSRVKF